ncbi:radical SAM family heme chaperone HemW [Marinicella rhabdoformis]|uniref:radical SAM family heme chaperone HemW n=1 Tax=Marinicella rhabdoformis TaxID=2580566 RepID=UPI0012AEBF89|nr:radical SAM family heme chaperone HemW [Marinicella rhabdoformis]
MLIPPPLSLYIHFPWCVKKCPYCDFNSHELKRELDQANYVDALLADLEQDLPSVWGRPISSVFMGGGTPSLFSAPSMQNMMNRVRAVLPFQPDAEVTMEVNPGSQEFDDLAGYLQAGINRLSFGIQSLKDENLVRLGRIHNSEQAIKAVQKAKTVGYDNFNVDMMFGLPGQSMAAAKEDLLRLIDMGSTHISYYQLTIEANTLFAVKTPEDLPDVEMLHDMFAQGQEILSAHGFEQYEVSAYAKPSRQSQHNMNYWRFGDYLGIGAGAHAKVTMGHSGEIIRTVKQKHPNLYLQHAGTPQRLMSNEVVDDSTLLFEFFLNHLRIKQAVQWSHFESCTGLRKDMAIEKLKPLAQHGWFTMDDSGLTLSEYGFLLSDEILQQLID